MEAVVISKEIRQTEFRKMFALAYTYKSNANVLNFYSNILNIYAMIKDYYVLFNFG